MKSRFALSVAVVALCSCGDGSHDDRPVPTTIVTSTTATTATSSTTQTTHTTASTTSVTTTTTTLLECTVSMEVVFSVTNAETLGALQYETRYPEPGAFLGEGGSVTCTKLAGDFAAFNDIDAEARLLSAFVATLGFSGPIDVATCDYCTIGLPPEPSDFIITIVDQSRPDFTPANATVAVTQVNVIAGPTTTTTIGP